MVTVKEAAEMIMDHPFVPRVTTVGLMDAVGRVLAEPVLADRDFPPFDRVTMDGIAISHAAWSHGKRTFPVTGIQAAGAPAGKIADPGDCMEVMTGAMLPEGCDAVIRYEDVDISEGKATVRLDEVALLENVHRRGTDARKGDTLLQPATRLSPAEIALLASVGKETVDVFAFPSIAIISTGDELVDIGTTPAPHQIRRSNSWALRSALRTLGADSALFHFTDDRSVLGRELAAIVQQYDVLILSGGVSKGKFDFVPEILEEVGVRKLFHHVSQRPGKPFWFGRSDSGKVAFALPGNPVSTFMCFHRYVKPWLEKSLGLAVREELAELATDFVFAPPLTFFLQVSATPVNGKLVAQPCAGGGSGDFVNLSQVTGFLELPLEKSEFKAGELYPYIPFRE